MATLLTSMLKTTGSSDLALKELGTDEVVEDSSRADETVVDLSKSSKSRKIVKSQKPSKVSKAAKVIGSEERLLKYQSSVNWIWKTRASVRALTVFRALFARPRSSLDTTFALIIGKANRAADTLSYFFQRSKEDFESRMLKSFAGYSSHWPMPMSRASTSFSSLTPLHHVFIYVAYVLPLLL